MYNRTAYKSIAKCSGFFTKKNPLPLQLLSWNWRWITNYNRIFHYKNSQESENFAKILSLWRNPKRNFSSVIFNQKKNTFDLVRKYNSLIQSGEIEENSEQNRVINELQQIGEKTLTHIELLNKYKKYDLDNSQATSTLSSQKSQSSKGFWGLFSSKPEPEEVKPVPKVPVKVIKVLPPQFKALKDLKGVYLHGNPGTGKTYIMDMFYNEITIKRKKRLHFAEFMLKIQEEEHRINQRKDKSEDTITKVGNDFCKNIDLICIDEFQVLHISDAMILKRLFQAFHNNNIICFITSNRPPQDLYLNGLQRFLFLPFIDMVVEEMEVISLDGVDYRTRDYFHGENKKRMRHLIWNEWTNNAKGEIVEVEVAQGRTLTIPKYHKEVAMMSFYDLWGKALGNSDYMALWDDIHTLILYDVPFLSLDERDYLRRFIWLVDCLYNNKVRLLISTHIDVTDIYIGPDEESEKDENFAFDRTLSRLIEMKSQKYLENSKASSYI